MTCNDHEVGVDACVYICVYQVSLSSLLYVVGGDDNGGLIHSYLKEVVPDPGDIIGGRSCDNHMYVVVLGDSITVTHSL